MASWSYTSFVNIVEMIICNDKNVENNDMIIKHIFVVNIRHDNEKNSHVDIQYFISLQLCMTQK